MKPSPNGLSIFSFRQEAPPCFRGSHASFAAKLKLVAHRVGDGNKWSGAASRAISQHSPMSVFQGDSSHRPPGVGEEWPPRGGMS